jgi:hypothetical protein
MIYIEQMGKSSNYKWRFFMGNHPSYSNGSMIWASAARSPRRSLEGRHVTIRLLLGDREGILTYMAWEEMSIAMIDVDE